MTRRESISKAILAGVEDLTKFETGGFSEAEKTLIEALVDRDKEKLNKAGVQVWDKIKKLQSDLHKINRPDNVLYGPDRKPVSEGYTKARLDEIEKLKKQIDKLEKAMEKAYKEGETNDLYNLAGGKDTPDQGGNDKDGGDEKTEE